MIFHELCGNHMELFLHCAEGETASQQICSQCLFYSKLALEGSQRGEWARMTTSLWEQAGIWWRTNHCLDFSLQNPSCACFGSQLSPCFAATATQEPSHGSAENRFSCISETKRPSSRWRTKNHSSNTLWAHHISPKDTVWGSFPYSALKQIHRHPVPPNPHEKAIKLISTL